MSRLSLILPFAALASVLGAACNGPKNDGGPTDNTPTDSGGETGIPGSTTEPCTFCVSGQVGNILAVHTLLTKQSPETFHVSAVFANALQGFGTAAGCLTNDICLQGLPTVEDTWVDTTNNFDLGSRDYTWNGYTLGVDTIQVPFINDADQGVQYYDYTLDGPPLDDTPVVTFSGEWGTYRSETDLVIPPIEVIEPAASDNIDVTSGTGEFRRTPGGEGQPYLRIHDGDFRRLYLLADDGEYKLDWASTGLSAAARPDIAMGRWSFTETTLNGNTLDLVGVTEQPCGVQVCDNFPQSNINGSAAGGNIGTTPKYLGVGYESLIYNGYWEDFQSGASTQSAAVIFTVFDDTSHPICQITYDASQAIPVPGNKWNATNGLPVWQGYQIPTEPGKGASTCGRVDLATYGFEDLRDWIEQYQWGIGIGEMSAAFDTDLSTSFAANWPALQPLVHSAYVTQDALDSAPSAQEMSFGRNIDISGCYAIDPNDTPDEAVPSATYLPNSVYEGSPYYLYTLR